MRMFKTPTMLLLLCLLATQYVREGAAQDINTTLNWVRIDCCQMLGVLTTYTVQSTGDKVDLGSCRSNECLELQVVQLFVNHTRSMLDSSSSFGSSNIESVRTSATHIEIMSSVLLQDTRKMLVLALLGRASLPENLREEHISLEYNDDLDILSRRDSFCSPRPEHAHATDRPATATFTPRPAHTRIGSRQDRRPVVSKRPLHSRAAAKMSPTSASARSPSWPPMPGPYLQRAATVWPERIQVPIAEQNSTQLATSHCRRGRAGR